MGRTFVTITEGNIGNEVGFWMRDPMLELWLRLLSLHLPDPDVTGHNRAAAEIRNRWLLASRGYFNGCVPHDMEYACATAEGCHVVRHAVNSLVNVLDHNDAPLDANTLNLLGIEGMQFVSIERERLRDIGRAFLDLLDGKITATASSTDIMPGSKPYFPNST